MALIRFVAAEWKMTYNSDFLKPMTGYLGRHFSKLYFLGQISLQFLSLSKLRISDKRLIWKKKIGEGGHQRVCYQHFLACKQTPIIL